MYRLTGIYAIHVSYWCLYLTIFIHRFLMCRMTGIFSYLSKVFFVGLIVLVTLMLIRTLTYPSQQPNVGQCSPSDADFIKLTDAMISNFQEILQIKTIAWSSSNIMLAEIKQVHHLLEKCKLNESWTSSFLQFVMKYYHMSMEMLLKG